MTLSLADLREADLAGANFTAAYFQADLIGAVADKDTVWSERFDPIAAGVTLR